jgi:hypothetical protein
MHLNRFYYSFQINKLEKILPIKQLGNFMPSAAAVAFGRGTDRLLLLFGDCWRDDLEINPRRKTRKRGAISLS